MSIWVMPEVVGRLGAAEAWIRARNPSLTDPQVSQRAGWILLGWFNPERLDALTREHTAFGSFQALVDAPGYRPTIRGCHELADGYDAAQAARGRSQRAYRGDR